MTDEGVTRRVSFGALAAPMFLHVGEAAANPKADSPFPDRGDAAAPVTREQLRRVLGDINVREDFGAIGDGVADDTSAFRAAINFAAKFSKSRRIVVPLGTWRITSELDLKNKRITLIGQGYQGEAPTIQGNFDGFIFDVSGTAVAYGEPSVFIGLKIENKYDGMKAGSAGCVDLRFTGLVKFQDCLVQAQNTGLLAGEAISLTLDNTYIIGASATNRNRIFSRGILGGLRNFKMFGGRIYGCSIAADISGDSIVFCGTNLEFNDIAFRTGAIASFLVIGGHIESSGMVLTNAQTLPTINASVWSDNGGEGTGWTGSITFQNTHIAFLPVGSGNGVQAPAFVIKSQASFTGNLILSGCSLAIPGALATISESFDRTKKTSVPSGLNVMLAGTTGFTQPATIPHNAYTNWMAVGSTGAAHFSSVQIDHIQGNVVGDGGSIAGFARYGLSDPAFCIDMSDGASLKGHTTASLKSSYHNQGVRMAWPHFVPTRSGVASLGSAALKWKDAHLANPPIVTSDQNAKTDIEDSHLGLGFIRDLRPRRYRKQESGNLTAGEEESFSDHAGVVGTRIKSGSQLPIPGQRFHEGFIAQEVKTVLDGLGVDSAMWVRLENGSQGLRYEELIGPAVKAIQELSGMVEKQNERIDALMEQMERLSAKIRH